MGSIEQANEAVATEWRERAEVDGGWRKAPNQAGTLGAVAQGESGGWFVELDELPGRRAYLKPLKRHVWFRAAREKIAFDLARDVGVNVPPVLLATNFRSDAKERNVCVSLVLYPHQFAWAQLRGFLASGEAIFASALEQRMASAAAAAFAFDTWLEQTDHADHPSNIVYGYSGTDYEQGRFAFLDYAFSMGISGTWLDGAFREVSPAGFPARMLAVMDRALLANAVGAIEAISDATIDEVVGRIPSRYLPDDEKAAIRAGLTHRRGLVRGALSDYLTDVGGVSR